VNLASGSNDVCKVNVRCLPDTCARDKLVPLRVSMGDGHASYSIAVVTIRTLNGHEDAIESWVAFDVGRVLKREFEMRSSSRVGTTFGVWVCLQCAVDLRAQGRDVSDVWGWVAFVAILYSRKCFLNVRL
jgi:hypothetical protein